MTVMPYLLTFLSSNSDRDAMNSRSKMYLMCFDARNPKSASFFGADPR
jgi:hypothetical protein